MSDHEIDRAQALLEIGQYDLAAAVAGGVLAREPDNPDALSVLSRAVAELQRIPEALDAARRAVAVAPQHLGAWTALALALQRTRDHRSAVWAARERLRLAPDDWVSHLILAEAMTGPPMQHGAVEAAHHVVRLAPHQAAAHTAVGNALLGVGKRKEAAASFARALAIDPSFVPALNGNALTLRSGHGVAEFAAAARGAPTDRHLSYNLRARLGRLTTWAWLITWGAGILMLVGYVLSHEFGLGEPAARVSSAVIAVGALLWIFLLTRRIVRDRRLARAVLRHVRFEDPALTGMLWLTGIALALLVSIPIGGPIAFAIAVLVAGTLSLIHLIVSLAWTLSIREEGKRL